MFLLYYFLKMQCQLYLYNTMLEYEELHDVVIQPLWDAGLEVVHPSC